MPAQRGFRPYLKNYMHRDILRLICVPAILGASFALAAVTAQHTVSQQGRQFRPNALTIKPGETIEFVNDDADLIHHVYIESDKFNFDSGDQGPGSRTSITFPTGGVFSVLCGIHPKMKLSVKV